LETRLDHWNRGLTLLRNPTDILLGLGAGRLPASYGHADGQPGFPGNVRKADIGVRLTGRAPGLSRSSFYGITQRVDGHPGPYRVEVHARADMPSWLLVKLCDAWLLHDIRCQWQQVWLPEAKDYTLSLELLGARLDQPRLPREHELMIAVPSGALQLNDVQLYAGQEQLVHNGDFSDGLARWWPKAQTYYLPWHIDNLYLELFIENGLPGLMLFLAMGAAALWRLAYLARVKGALGKGAVFVGTALCGALLLGLINSVIDMPRVAWLLWLLLWVGLLTPLPHLPERLSGLRKIVLW
jgi:hypothetical protein